MGWERLPKPGTTLGPCTSACAHRDCALTRAMAAQRCTECGEPIGYDRPFCVADGETPAPSAPSGDASSARDTGWSAGSVGRPLAPLAHHACLVARTE